MPKKTGKRKMKGGMRYMSQMQGMNGANAFTDFFTKTIPNAAKTVYNKALKPVGNFIKDKKIISTVGNALGAVGVPYAGTVGRVAGAVGLGKKRRKGRMRGSGAVRF